MAPDTPTFAGIVILLSLFVPSLQQAFDSALYEYVHRPDSSYHWEIAAVYTNRPEVTTYAIYLESQQWLTEDIVDRTLWYHWLNVHIPTNIRFPDAGYLHIGTGSNSLGVPNENASGRQRDFAVSMGVVTAELRYIPNQPLRFNGGRPRSEDDLIAWTWRAFIETLGTPQNDPEILARMPMLKSAIRAIDTMVALTEQETGNTLTKFMTSGESKRGWVCWLTPVVDSRVVAMVPSVLSILNMQKNMVHHYRSLGGWSFAFFNYWTLGLTRYLNQPELLDLMEIVDPYTFLESMKIPKYVIKGASDEFFMPDDTRLFFNDLQGPSYLWLIENTGHGVGGDTYWQGIETFYRGVLTGYDFPEISWDIVEELDFGRITLNLSPDQPGPREVTVWAASSASPNRRDFRVLVLRSILGIPSLPVESGVRWNETPATFVNQTTYTAEFSSPESGFLAFYIKIQYDGPDGRNLIFTTEAAVIPGYFPFENCGDNCFSNLV